MYLKYCIFMPIALAKMPIKPERSSVYALLYDTKTGNAIGICKGVLPLYQNVLYVRLLNFLIVKVVFNFEFKIVNNKRAFYWD